MKKGQMGMIKILVVMILHVDSSRMAMIKFCLYQDIGRQQRELMTTGKAESPDVLVQFYCQL